MTYFYCKKKIAALLMIGCIFLSLWNCDFVQAKTGSGQDDYGLEGLYAKAWTLMDGENGRILCQKNGEELKANASTTKILSCIVALENGDENQKITISKNAQNQPKVRLGVKEGEQYRLADLLYALMLESYNDCAVAIAEGIAGNVNDFMNMVNNKAKDIGCTDTYFLTPNGLDKKDDCSFHHTTANDLARMMTYCVWDSPCSERFCQISATDQYEFTGENNKNYVLYNHNHMLGQEGVLAGKTGYTAAAGYCYVMAYEKNQKKFCIALLACGWPNHKDYKWADTKRILAYGEANYDVIKIALPKQLPDLELKSGRKKNDSLENWGKSVTVPINVEKKQRYCLVEKNEKLEGKLTLYNDEYVKEGEVVGKINYTINGYPVAELQVKAMETVVPWGLTSFMILYIENFLSI